MGGGSEVEWSGVEWVHAPGVVQSCMQHGLRGDGGLVFMTLGPEFYILVRRAQT